MAFDQATRNRLQTFVGDARKLLSEEFTQQLQNTYGLDPVTGAIAELNDLPSLSPSEQQTAKLLRDTLKHYLAASHKADPYANKAIVTAALDRIVREQAFTVLNRLAALRMAEARQFLMESISQGYQSKGFQLYQRIAGSTLGETGQAYQIYLFSVFDELSLDLAVLFDRYSSQGRLFPRETVLLELLDLINHTDLELLWAEDETIGWIYQYFNSKDERKKMRDESKAPRNSRELAVRNQFFTPRYVVEFLTDNTLGRIWYEMTKGHTTLVDSCRYLVRRPHEVFLETDQQTPGVIASQEDKELSQEELLQQTVYVQHRPLKDPRDIKMLDPACGSMHFGLYAFDLFEKIYSEAWDLEESNAQGGFVREDSDKTPSGNVLQSLHHAYNSKDAFLADVPRLIIEHNIHGVDIDPRAVQIAGLSLWLRAQRSWSGNAIHPNKRPQIQRSNIVCAEPMPGEKELLKEFASQIQPRVLGQLVEEIFDKMQLAGEAGTLLKIEEEIQTAIDEAKAQKNEGGHWEQGGLFGKNKWEVRDGTRYNFDGNISDDFWDQAEFLMLAELERYAESSTGEGSIQKRLFALDAAKGFSFIDLCRKRFDVVLMNPPFGDISFNIIDFIKEKYAEEKQEFYSCFITNASNQLLDTGMLGVICGRPAFYAEGLEEWRHKTLNNFHCSEFLDLGGGVLDAMVETVASCWSKNKENNYIDFFRVNGEEDKGDALAEILSNNLAASRYLFPEAALNKIPKSTFAYWLPAHIVNWFTDLPRMCDIEFDVKIGIQTDNDFRYSRLHWEVPMSEKAYVENVENVDWNSLYFEECKNKTWAVQLKGSESNPFFVDFPLLVNWRGNGAELKAQTIAKFGNYGKRIYNEYVFFRSGFSWSIRTDYFSPHMVPPGTIPTVSRYLAVAKEGIDSLSVIAKLNTALYEVLVRTRMGKWTQPLYMSGVIEGLPCINDPLINERLHKLSVEAVKILEMAYSHEETSNYYRGFSEKNILNDKLMLIIGKIEDLIVEIDGVEQSDIDFSLSEINRFNFGKLKFDLSFVSQSKVSHKALSYLVGCAFARWDFNYNAKQDINAIYTALDNPIPISSPAQLINSSVMDESHGQFNEIMPIDGDHSNDLCKKIYVLIGRLEQTGRLSESFAELQNLPQCELSSYFEKPNKFFSDHLRQYTKSRRQAPIYWPIQTSSCTYTFWLYYHALNEQTLFSCVNNFVDLKLEAVVDDISSLRSKPSRSSNDERVLASLIDLEAELKDFRDELLHIAQFWKPNLNDGVQITAAPLWKLFQHKTWQKKLKRTWEELEQGKYDWSHMAYNIWPERVLKICHQDRSIAIAHDVEADLWEEVEVPAARGKGTKWVWHPKEMTEAELDAYIQLKIAKG